MDEKFSFSCLLFKCDSPLERWASFCSKIAHSIWICDLAWSLFRVNNIFVFISIYAINPQNNHSNYKVKAKRNLRDIRYPCVLAIWKMRKGKIVVFFTQLMDSLCFRFRQMFWWTFSAFTFQNSFFFWFNYSIFIKCADSWKFGNEFRLNSKISSLGMKFFFGRMTKLSFLLKAWMHSKFKTMITTARR